MGSTTYLATTKNGVNNIYKMRQAYIGDSNNNPKRIRELWVATASGNKRIYWAEVILNNPLTKEFVGYGAYVPPIVELNDPRTGFIVLEPNRRYLVRYYTFGLSAYGSNTGDLTVHFTTQVEIKAHGTDTWSAYPGSTQQGIDYNMPGHHECSYATIYTPSVQTDIRIHRNATGNGYPQIQNYFPYGLQYGCTMIVDITDLEDYLGSQFPDANSVIGYIGSFFGTKTIVS